MTLTREKCAEHYQNEILAAKGVNGKRWCVPSAISYLTGKDYEDAEEHLKPFLTRRRRRGITWVWRSEWQACLEVTLPHVRLFYCRSKDNRRKRQTLAANYATLRRGKYFIQTSRHVLLMIDGEIYDNRHSGKLPYGLKGYWKCRVLSIWIIS